MRIFLIAFLSFCLLGLLSMLVLAKIIHNKLFNHRYEFDARIKCYTSGDFSMHVEPVQVKCRKNTLRGYLYSCENPDKSKLVVVCHGMWSSKEAYMQEVGWFASHGLLVLAFDYAGTHESSGKLDCFGNSLRSTDAMLDFVQSREDLKGREIFVVGHSWGGFAATNVVAFHPEIKGVVALSPVLSMKEMLRNSSPRYPAISRAFFIFIDYLKCGKYALVDGIKSLENFAKNGGRVLVVQSDDDGVVPYKSSLGLLRRHFGLSEAQNSVEDLDMKFITVKNRRHNPHYTDAAIALLDDFYAELARTKKEDLGELYARSDFHAMGKLDDSIMQQAYDMIFAGASLYN